MLGAEVDICGGWLFRSTVDQNRPDSSSLDGSWAQPEQNSLRLTVPIYV